MIQDYRDLVVLEQGMAMVHAVYRATECFPAQESHDLRSQMRKAAVAIPANIVEGHARERADEYLFFLSEAEACLAKLDTDCEIATRLKYLPPDLRQHITDQISSLSRQIGDLRNALAESRRAHAD